MVVYCKERILAANVKIADTFISRFKGLMGQKKLGDGEGLMLMNCFSVHSFFMKISIDVVYLSKDMMVLGVETLAPWNIGKYVKNTVHVLELPAYSVWASKGDVLKIYNH